MAEEAVIRPAPRRKAATIKVEAVARTPRRNQLPGWWDKPRLVNALADILGLFGLFVLLFAAGYWVLSRPVFPVRAVLIATPLGQVTSAQVSYAARSAIKGNFFTVDLVSVRSAFEKLPWVRRAEVRRIWPDTLELKIEEQEAVAYWMEPESGDTRLVNKQGEVFYASSANEMPVLSGAEGTTPRILKAYQDFAPLVRPLGRLAEVSMNERQAWTLKMDSGLSIVVGREQNGISIEQLLSRFTEVYANVKGRFPGKVALADLRYPSGFTLKSANAVVLPPNDAVPDTPAIPPKTANTGRNGASSAKPPSSTRTGTAPKSVTSTLRPRTGVAHSSPKGSPP